MNGPKVGVVVIPGLVFKMPEDYEFLQLAMKYCLNYVNNTKRTVNNGYIPMYDEEYNSFTFDERGLFEIVRSAKHDRTRGIAWRLYGQMSKMGMPVIMLGIFDDLKKLNEKGD